MPLVKVSELTGATLDWCVAHCQGLTNSPESWLYNARLKDVDEGHYKPSKYWGQGGPIIERERIDLQAKINAGSDYDEWLAVMGVGSQQRRRYGPTPLIAAMRCYVASKLGGEVEIPEELT